MTLSTKTDHFLLNHRFAMNADKPRYSLHCQYKKDNVRFLPDYNMLARHVFHMDDDAWNEGCCAMEGF